jgi:hypothetical protein
MKIADNELDMRSNKCVVFGTGLLHPKVKRPGRDADLSTSAGKKLHCLMKIKKVLKYNYFILRKVSYLKKSLYVSAITPCSVECNIIYIYMR